MRNVSKSMTMTTPRLERTCRRVCYAPTFDSRSASTSDSGLGEQQFVSCPYALDEQYSSVNFPSQEEDQPRQQQKLKPHSTLRMRSDSSPPCNRRALVVRQPHGQIVTSTSCQTDASRRKRPKSFRPSFHPSPSPSRPPLLGNSDVKYGSWIIHVAIFCALVASANCVIEGELSTVPTIPIPDGFTVDNQLGGNPDSSSRRADVNSEDSFPCTANSSLDYQIVHLKDGWSSCFELVNEMMDWAFANATCFHRGGHLARPLSAADTRLIEAMLDRHPVSRDYWIDANDMNTEGEWRWTDGTDIDYVNWRPGKPINSSRHFSRDCAELHRNFRWKWNDKDCVDRNNFFICQHHLLHIDNDSLPDSSSSKSSTPAVTHRPSVSSTSFPSTTTTTTTYSSSHPLSSTTSLNPDSFKTETTKSALKSTTTTTATARPNPIFTTEPSDNSSPSREIAGSDLPETDPANADSSSSAPYSSPPSNSSPLPDLSPTPPFVSPTDSSPPSRISDSLSSGQIALVLLCIVAILLLAFVIGLVVLPNFRRKMVSSQGSSPSSPSSSIESQAGSSLNSSSSLESNDSKSPQPWVAVLKFFPSRQDSSSSSIRPPRGIVPTVTIDTSPPRRLPDDVVASAGGQGCGGDSPDHHYSSAVDNTDFLRVNAAQFALARSNSVSSNASPYGLPAVDVSPQLPDFTIRRKSGAAKKNDAENNDAAVEGETPRRRLDAPRWRLFSTCSGGSENRGIGVSNPVFMADVVDMDPEDKVDDVVDGGGPVDGDVNDGGEGVLRRESPSPTLPDVRLEMDLGEYSNDYQQQQPNDELQSRGGINLPMTTRNIFMKEVLRRGSGGNTFKYDKF